MFGAPAASKPAGFGFGASSAPQVGGAGPTATGFGGFGATPSVSVGVGGAGAGAGAGFGTTPSVSVGVGGAGFGGNSFTATNTATNTSVPVQGASFGTGAWGAGAASASSWGSAANKTGTAVANSGAGGWGAAPSSLGGQPQQLGFGTPAIATQTGTVGIPVGLATMDVAKQSAIGRYLLELDSAYSALNPRCKFRAFVYNICTPGQGERAVERERYIAALAGGGCKEEEWVLARDQNPDPENMYPAPIHFMQELLERAKKQEEAIGSFQKVVDTIVARTQRLKEIQEQNAAAQRKLELEHVMLQRRWLSLLRKSELIRLAGKPLSDEQQEIGSPVSALLAMLNAPGHFKSAVSDVQPFVEAEAAMLASVSRHCGYGLSDLQNGGTGGLVPDGHNHMDDDGRGGLLTQQMDAFALNQLVQYVDRMQEGLEALGGVLTNDLSDVTSIRAYLANNSA